VVKLTREGYCEYCGAELLINLTSHMLFCPVCNPSDVYDTNTAELPIIDIYEVTHD